MSKYHHDWRQMLNEYEQDPHHEMHCYDEIDMKSSHRSGFWIGAIFAFFLTVGLLAGVGLYYNGGQLP